MVIPKGGKLLNMRLETRGSDLICKVANKCLNVLQRVEVVDSRE